MLLRLEGGLAESPVIVCADSQAALATLASGAGSQATALGAAVWRLLLALTDGGRRVFMQWIPAHCGIPGNERADVLAKEASSLSQDAVPTDVRSMVKAVGRSATKAWRRSWPDSFFKTIMGDRMPMPVLLESRDEAVNVHQLRAGHWSRSQSYLHRIGRRPERDCPQCSDLACPAARCLVCREGPDTPEHVLLRSAATSVTKSRWATVGREPTRGDQQQQQQCHRLAQVLVGLDCSRGYVADEEAESIVHLWHQLSAGDRAKVAASPRYQHRLTTGRFKQPKTSRLSGVVPGVDSARRVSLKRGAVPAQRPDLNRLAETVVRLLCERYRNPRRSGGSVQSRWAQILAHHSSLRDILLKCPAITQRTGVNLAALNQHTLTSWFNEHQKETERRALLQGVQLPPARPIAAVALPAPAPRLMQVQVVRVDCRRPPHHFVLPADTVGQAQTRRRPAEDTGHDTAAKRPYTRRQPTNTCGQCKGALTADTGHRRGKGGP
ncbi:uncharacterized protein LOC122379678 [Amphibalanus amphitrite]|uniref:uncharacterized protein LOC122379678 n=1 Tax=Amphibalanus amphitrite TaxID=1232801 RepID=UPI001C90F0B3|nr:uncharacterized protein LOC122379678 [Amphibalanus amphitrite]